jgi:hypothetical protein
MTSKTSKDTELVKTKVNFVSLGKGDHPVTNPGRLFKNRSSANDNGYWRFIHRDMFIGEQAKRWSHFTKDPSLQESVGYEQKITELFGLWTLFHHDVSRSHDQKPDCVQLFEVIPSATNEEDWVGMGMFIRSQSDLGVSIPLSWDKMLYNNKKQRNLKFNSSNGDDDDDGMEDDNGDRKKKRKKSQANKWAKIKKKTDPKFTYTDMTILEWEQLCFYYMGKVDKKYRRDWATMGPISHSGNPLNPQNVFTLDRFMEKCRLAGANPAYYDRDSYADPSNPAIWALPENGKNFYRIRRQEMEPGPDGIWSYFFPQVPRPVRINGVDRQRQLFIQQGGDESIANQIFNKHADDDAMTSEATLAANMQSEIHKTKQALDDGTPDGLARYSKALHKIRQKGLREWFSVAWNPDSEVSNSVKAVHDWFNAYIHTNGREKVVHRTVPPMSGNLKSSDDKLVQMNLMLDIVFSMRNMQQELFVLILGAFQVPLKTGLHLHVLLTGPPEIGKTYIAEVLRDLFIPGTCNMVNGQSEKANTNGGCAASNQSIIREECIVSLFKSVMGQFSDDDLVAHFKSLLSSSVVNTDRTIKDPITGALSTKHITTELNCQHICCANASLKDADESVTSRMYTVSCSKKDVEYWRELRAANIDDKPGAREFRNTVCDYFRLQQAFCFMIASLINCGVLPQIDLEVPNAILRIALEKAARKGVPGATNKRNFQRLQFVCQSLVMLRAILKLWESSSSPLAGEPFQYDHLLLVAPYLVGEVGDAVQAVTLLQNQFESPLQRDVLDVLQKDFFKMEMNGIDQMQRDRQADTEAVRRQEEHTSVRAAAGAQTTIDSHLHRRRPDCPPECIDTNPSHTHFESFTGMALDHENYVYRPLSSIQPRRRLEADKKDAPEWARMPQDHFKSEGQKIGELTRQLTQLMKGNVLSDDVFMILRNLSRTSIPNKDGQGRSPALMFANDIVGVNKALFYRNQEERNVMLDIIKKVVRHRYSRGQRLLLLSMNNATGVFDTVDIPAGDASLPEMKIHNYNFIDQSTRTALGSVVAALQNGPGTTRSTGDVAATMARDKKMTGVFADRPFYMANADLDEAHCVLRRRQLAFTDEYVEAMRLAPLDPQEYEIALSLATDRDLLSDYPAFLKFMDMKAVMRQFEADSKDGQYRHEYEISTRMEESAKMLSTGRSEGTFFEEEPKDNYESEDEDKEENQTMISRQYSGIISESSTDGKEEEEEEEEQVQVHAEAEGEVSTEEEEEAVNTVKQEAEDGDEENEPVANGEEEEEEEEEAGSTIVDMQHDGDDDDEDNNNNTHDDDDDNNHEDNEDNDLPQIDGGEHSMSDVDI